MKKLSIILVLVIYLAACTSGTKEKKTQEYSNSEFAAFKGKALSIIPNKTSSTDLALFFESIGAPYMPNLINDAAGYEKYKASKLIAGANIGVYFADALYQRSYGRVNEAFESTNAAIQLATALNLKAILEELTKANDRFETMTIDSLIMKMDESLMQSAYIIPEQERMQIYISMLTGNFIQKQYILLSLIFENTVATNENEKLVLLNELLLVVMQYSEATQSLIQLIEAFKPAEGSGFLIAELITYGDDYKSLNISINLNNLTPEIVSENEILKRMYTSIKSMRNHIVNPMK